MSGALVDLGLELVWFILKVPERAWEVLPTVDSGLSCLLPRREGEQLARARLREMSGIITKARIREGEQLARVMVRHLVACYQDVKP
jgi:hypothetical protein